MKTSSIICSLLLSTLTVPAAADPSLSYEPASIEVDKVSPMTIEVDKKKLEVHFVRFGTDLQWFGYVNDLTFITYLKKYGYRPLTACELEKLQPRILTLRSDAYLKQRDIIALGSKILSAESLTFACIDHRNCQMSSCAIDYDEWFAGDKATFPVVKINRP